jgi:glycosyltransferase involved in cell wall biosynthesis
MLTKITPVILTYNEEANIGRTLKQLSWARRIVLVDSYSDDKTFEILSSYSQVEVFQRKFDTHAQQWNYGLGKVKSEWVLSLDADYCISDKLIDEMNNLSLDDSIDGYFIPFKYCVFSQPLRGTILPPRQALFRRWQSHYIDDGHTQLLQLNGQSGSLNSYIYHDDRKSLSRWLWSQNRYLTIEAQKLKETPWSDLSWGDRIRTLKIIAPVIVLFYCLILKGGILDGWPGWYYAFQRLLAEVILSLKLIEKEQES